MHMFANAISSSKSTKHVLFPFVLSILCNSESKILHECAPFSANHLVVFYKERIVCLNAENCSRFCEVAVDFAPEILLHELTQKLFFVIMFLVITFINF